MSRHNVRTEASLVSPRTGYEAPADYQVNIIDDWDGFCAVRPQWDAVYHRDPESHFFLSWGWLAELFRHNPARWRVFAVRGKGLNSGYVGFFPAKYRVHWSASSKSFQTEIEAGGRLGWSEYTGFLCDPAHEEQVMAALADKLSALPWVRLSVCYEPSRRRADLFMNAFSTDQFRCRYRDYRINKGQTDNLVCPQITLPPDYETYLQTCISSNTRQKIRRFTRKLIDTGDLHVVQTTAENFDRHADILFGLWKQKWSSVKGAKRAEIVVTMYREMLHKSLTLGALHLPVLWRGEDPLGALGCIVDADKKHLHFVVSGREEAESGTQSGLLLHAQSIRWAIENNIEVYDFGHGNEAYKYSFGARDQRVKYFAIQRRRVADTGLLDPLNVREVVLKASQASGPDKAEKTASTCRQLLSLLEFEQQSS
ncbi:MAG: GNAT family N-acetyltransferase [Rhizobiaceae bacterium]